MRGRMKRSPLLSVFLTVVIDLLGFGLVLPLLPQYGKLYGASGFVVGMLFASFSGMQFLFAPIWGRLSDRIGRGSAVVVRRSADDDLQRYDGQRVAQHLVRGQASRGVGDDVHAG